MRGGEADEHLALDRVARPELRAALATRSPRVAASGTRACSPGVSSVRGGVVAATATPLHVGSTLIVVETEVRRDDGRLAAKTTQTQAVLRG